MKNMKKLYSGWMLVFLMTSTVGYAQISKEVKIIKKPVVIGTTKLPPGPGPKKLPKKVPQTSPLSPGDLTKPLNNDRLARFLLKPMVNVLGGTKISTTIIPVDQLSGVVRSGRAPKPRTKGSQDKGDRICTNYSVSLSPSSESFDAPLADKMAYTYPGAGYNYTEYIQNNTQPKHNQTKRNPIILQVSPASGDGKKIVVNDPNFTALNEAVGKLKTGLPPQANNLSTEIYVQTIVNDASFALNVEAGGGGYGFKANAKFQTSYNSKKAYMSIDCKQKNYVITANLPDGSSAFYQDPAENEKNDNVYMSSVTYGRRVIGVIETELNSQSQEIGAKIAYEGFGMSADFGMKILNKLDQSKTSVRLLFIGGNGAVINVPNPTEASVMAVINGWMSNTNAQAAVPIEYTFRNMRNVGMRWESVASNINYEQCIPKPPAGSAAPAWNISVTLNSISNNMREKVKLGVQQFVGVEVNNQWKEENSKKTGPIICYMQDWQGCLVPPLIDFSFQGYSPGGASFNYTLSHEEYQQNPKFWVDTKRIVTYRTSAGGSKNENVNNPKFSIMLKDIKSNTPFNVPVHINGRVFSFNYTVAITQQGSGT